MINNNKATTSKSLTSKIIGITSGNTNRLNPEVFAPLKYLDNLWRSPDLTLINYEIELDLSRSRNCVMSEILRTFRAAANTNPVWYEKTSKTTSSTLQINNAKLYVQVITLAINDNINFLGNMKHGFKRIISWDNTDLKIQSN